MIYGEKHPTEAEQQKIDDAQVHNWFAWHPVQLEDGRWAFWENIWKDSEHFFCGFDYDTVHKYYPTQSDYKNATKHEVL